MREGRASTSLSTRASGLRRFSSRATRSTEGGFEFDGGRRLSLMELDGKKVLVIGAGRSGVAAARFCAARGALVVLNDRKEFIDWSNDALALKGEGVVKLLAGDVPSWLLDQIELVVISPGVPAKSIPARSADRAGAEVLGEIELAWRFLRGRVVGITGTNGK